MNFLARPDLVIVGAPKCGTTSLDAYLNQHPAVFMARKEQHHFGSDLTLARRSDADEYAQSFIGGDQAQVKGESSVWYLYSKLSAQEIHACNPRARIIAMVRNPADLLYSLHSHFFHTGGEDISDFGKALAAEEDRRRGRRIPHANTYSWGLFYRDVPRYREQLERYFDVFGREQVHVVLYDDLAHEPHRTHTQVLEFLDLDTSHAPDFTVHNSNRQIRFGPLQTMVYSLPPSVRGVARTLLPSRSLRRRLRHRVVAGVERFNVTVAEREPLNPTLRSALTAEFRPEIEWLAAVLDRDLGHWLAAADEPPQLSGDAPSQSAFSQSG